MSVAANAQTSDQDGGGDGPPSWSGVPVIAGNCMILPLHIADTRQITFGPKWVHIDQWPNEGGDIEYHVFRRST